MVVEVFLEQKGFLKSCFALPMELSFAYEATILAIISAVDFAWSCSSNKLCWALWYVRNSVIFGDLCIPLHFALACLLALVHEANTKVMGSMYNSILDSIILYKLQISCNMRKAFSVKVVFWHFPLSGWLRVNFDDST